jgi:WxcM-like, C-terminal
MQTIPQTYSANPLQSCNWLDFTVMHDARGNLSVIENHKHIPFDIRRIYYLYDIPAQAERAGHAHRNLAQVFISMSGSFDLHLDDGVEKRTIHLCRANRGYLVQPWTWRTLDNFSGSSVCLVLASLPYDEKDYIRSYAEFQRLAEQRKGLYE